MDFLYIVLASICSIIVLFLLTKIIGNRQMSQLSMFDYINGITIGSIAAEMATAIEDVWQPLVAMIIYAIAAVSISLINSKSIRMRRILNGKSLVLFENGKLYFENLKKAKLDLGEFLSQCRISGFFDLSQLQAAVLETNGHISFLPMEDQRPLTPKDLHLTVAPDRLVANVILDGQVMEENLHNIGNNQEWLEKQLKQQHYKVSEILLATCDCQNTLTIYPKTHKRKDRDIFD
ncbi:MAG: DUF421 domain-containing protein [Clostridiales bacterium]|jgi:uncharacterized membrane protein YcaP (DUF421 family)|nr:DUF421 domain-containing protein [Clostridiales bacterium]